MRSMTGYGKAERVLDGKSLMIEIKSVNNRYLDINTRLPKCFLAFEDILRKTIQKAMARGRVDVFLTYEDKSERDKKLRVDTGLAAGYVQAARELAAQFSLTNDLTVSMLLRTPDVVSLEGVDENADILTELLRDTLEDALKQINVMRDVEGEAMRLDIEQRLDTLSHLVAAISQQAPLVAEELGKKLKLRVSETLAGIEVDENRLLSEIAFYTDRVNIDEEIARLYSHMAQMRTLIAEDLSGRKLDFLVQELNREANTVCSKANNQTITALGLSLKSEIEKIREQVQNIE